MAWGPWANGNKYYFRAGVTASVTSTDSKSTVKVTARVQGGSSTVAINYGQSRVRYKVDDDDWQTVDTVYPTTLHGAVTKTVQTPSFSVSRQYGKAQTVTVEHWYSSPNSSTPGFATGSTVTTTVTVPAREYSEPSAPSSCSASRQSDSQAKVSWENGSTSTSSPRSSTKVERQTDGGSWVQVASVGGSVTSYTDNAIGANHRYAYRVRAYNSSGYSSYSTSGYIYTTPAAPTSVTASVTQGTSVRIGVSGSNAPYATGWEVQYSLNGGAWQELGTYDSFPVTANLGGGSVQVRARAARGSMASAWVESSTITTITSPLAPTVTLSPSGVVPTGTRFTVSWVPNHPDGSDQTSAQVETKFSGIAAPAVTTDVDGSTTTLVTPTYGLPGTLSARVRTHGADDDWGAWSDYATVTVAYPPSVAITSPGSDGALVADLPLDVTWEVEDTTGVASQTLALLDASGRTLHTAQLAASARSYTLGASTYLLANSTDYTLRLTVTGGSSLQTVAERDFSTSFAEPSAPVASVEVDESDMSCAITVQAGDASTEAGGVVTVAEHAPAGTPVPGFTVYGATRQNLWVNPSGMRNGVIATSNDDGSMTLSGTSTASTSVQTPSIYILRPATTYLISSDKAPTQGVVFAVYYFDSGGKYTGHIDLISATAKQATFTTPGDFAHATFRVYVPSGTTASGTYRVMLNEGSEAQPWCPPGLNGVDELSVVCAGKNLIQRRPGLAASTIYGVTFTPLDDGGILVDGTNGSGSDSYYNIDFINDPISAATPAPPAGTTVTQSGGTDGIGLSVNVFLDDGSYVSVTSENALTATIPDRATHLRSYIYVRTGVTVDNVTVYPQLELGSTATDYEPPQVTTTSIDLDGHVLNSLPDGTRDELSVDATGAVTLTKRVGVATLPGDAASWVEESQGIGRFRTNVSPAAKSAYTPGSALCDALPYRVGSDDPYDGTNIIAADNWAYATIGDGDTASLVASACGGKTLLYALATPQVITLPSVTLPSWPEGEANLWASSPVPTEMRVDYPDVSSLTVQRVTQDGSTWLVGDSLGSGETVIDPLPPLGVPFEYVVTAHTAAGASSELRVPQRIETLVGAFNFGQAAGVCELARLDPSWGHDVARSGTLYHFADGGEGGGLPVAYGGQDVDAARTMGFTLLDLDQLRRLQDIARRYFTCWYRDPYGGRALCAVSWSFSSGIPYDMLTVSASMTETVFEEAW